MQDIPPLDSNGGGGVFIISSLPASPTNRQHPLTGLLAGFVGWFNPQAVSKRGRHMNVPSAASVIYEADGPDELFSTVHEALSPGSVIVAERRAFELTLGIHHCGIVCARAATPGLLSWIAGLSIRHTECPIILVTPLTTDSARGLLECPAGRPQVVWLEDVPVRLANEVTTVVGNDPVSEILNCLAASLSDSPITVNALMRMSHADPPFSAVRDLAEDLGVARDTLRYHWIHSTGSDPTLKESLEWVLLLRAVELSHLAPVRVAYRVGIHLRTLQRLSERRLGLTWAGTRRHGVDFVTRRFRERLGELLA